MGENRKAKKGVCSRFVALFAPHKHATNLQKCAFVILYLCAITNKKFVAGVWQVCNDFGEHLKSISYCECFISFFYKETGRRIDFSSQMTSEGDNILIAS